MNERNENSSGIKCAREGCENFVSKRDWSNGFQYCSEECDLLAVDDEFEDSDEDGTDE